MSRVAIPVATWAAIGLGAALRVLGSRGDPWLDEVWSWVLAREPDSAWGVFTFAHDNNHVLNTLWLRAIPDDAPAWVWRLPAVLFGVAFLVLLPRRHGRVTAALGATLAASSFLLAVMQSEARGYSGMLFAALVAAIACRAQLETPAPRWNLVFGAACVLGILSHATFVHAWAALAAWSACRLARTSSGIGAAARTWLALHAVPIGAFTVFTFGFLARMTVGGGPERALRDVLAETLVLATGAPRGGAWELVAAALFVLVLVVDIFEDRRSGSDAWIVTLVAVLVAPALLLAAWRPEFLAPRYFLVPVAFWTLAFARVLGRLVDRGGWARVAACALLAAFLVGNALRIAPFLRHGRGQYRTAFEHVRAHSTGEETTLASADDFDAGFLARFFVRSLPPGPRIVLVGRGLSRGADWYLAQSYEDAPDIAPELRLGPFHYELAAHYPCHGPSGTHWILYRRSR